MTLVRTVIIPVAPLLLLMTWLTTCDCAAQVREVRSVFLNDIGVVRQDRQGEPYVTINPLRCRQLGPELCEFFRQHEYGHVNLNHFGRGTNIRRAEAEADCYAAKNVSPSVANAAIDWFNSGKGSSRDHGSSSQRAARVSTCSQKKPPINTRKRASVQNQVTRSKKPAVYSAGSIGKKPPTQKRTKITNSTTNQNSNQSRQKYVKSPVQAKPRTVQKKRVSSSRILIRPANSAQYTLSCRSE